MIKATANQNTKCQCGCGQEVKPGNRYIRGHNNDGRKSATTRQRLSESLRNRKQAYLVHCGWCFKPLRRAEWEMTNSDGSLKNYHYCNLACTANHRGELHKGENSHYWKGGMETRPCSECGNPITRHHANFKSKLWFCSSECDKTWRIKNVSGPNHPQWQGGISFEEYCSEWKDAEYKRDIRIRDHETCFLCGSQKKLCIHHIDYEKKNCQPSNLITLCNPCNSKANFNREFWKAYFQSVMSLGKVQRLSLTGVGPSGPKRGATQVVDDIVSSTRKLVAA